ncbi:MAG: hypothetical protein ACJA2S_005836 [Cyclobacteriaceae bacterium]|jgi:hypothetical protein
MTSSEKTSTSMRNLTTLFLVLFSTAVQAQQAIDFQDQWQYYSDNENSLYQHFCLVAFEKIDLRKTKISKLKNKTDWLSRQSLVRSKLSELVGPLPDKSPLNAQITEIIKKKSTESKKSYTNQSQVIM